MNVTESDMITSTVQHLRQNVYNSDRFKNAFSSQLQNKIYAVEVSYVAEQFGGWSVDVVLNRNKGVEDGIESQSSEFYIDKVLDALINAACAVDHSIMSLEIGPNIINVIVTGPNSITIKI